uniref:Uncharacterized protein n=2 Tax=Aegilops tauschii subsp. strangulata TaxID=200361 RepID=A0A452ZDP4_AEGTS
MPFFKRINLTLSVILEGYSGIGAKRRYILPPHTSTLLTQILILEKLQPQRKRGEPQPGVIEYYGTEMGLRSHPTSVGSLNFLTIVLSVDHSLWKCICWTANQRGAHLTLILELVLKSSYRRVRIRLPKVLGPKPQNKSAHAMPLMEEGAEETFLGCGLLSVSSKLFSHKEKGDYYVVQ